MSCTMGKGNLIYRPTGKSGYTFIDRKAGRAMRFYCKVRRPDAMTRGAFQEYILNAPVDEIFDCREAKIPEPEPARIFSTITCEVCGEAASENKMRLQDGKKVCLDCFQEYHRGW
jgi:formylmethanofuran dehydrogenase subunit E